MMRQIPERLRDERFNFILLRNKDKIPLEKNWQEKNQYKYDNELLASHLAQGGNLGIACNNGVPLIIDFDDENIEKEIAPRLPKTFTVRSGRGRLHKYYLCSHPENLKILDKNKKTLCDIQADRKQVVVPPSIHPNGNEYYVIDDCALANIDMSEIKALFYEYLPKNKMSTIIHSNTDADFVKKQVSFERLLLHYGVDVSSNPTMCPLGHSSQSRKCFHYDDSKGVAHCFHCDWGGDVISLVEEKEKLDFVSALNWLSANFGIKTPKGDVLKVEKKVSVKELAWQIAQTILSKHSIICYGDKERAIFYIYKDGFYQNNGRQVLRSIIQDLVQEEGTLHLKAEVLEHIYSSTIVSELPEVSVEWICLENGLLNVVTREFVSHTPSRVFFQKLPLVYEPSRKCLVIDKFLKEVLNKSDLRTIQKWVGYCLLKDYRYHNLLMLNGGGANGKSTFLSLMKTFLGVSNVCSVPMQQLEEDKFALVLLKDKMANIFADLPSQALKSTSKLKGLTGEDNFSADQKFKDFMGFVNYAKFMYSCNQLPIIPEDSTAIWRRFILVDFPNTFPIESRDVNLLKKMTTREELSGFLNYALDGLSLLFEDNGFDLEVKQTREVYIRKTDPIGSFVLDCLEAAPSVETPKEEIYDRFLRYCDLKGYDFVPDNAFFRVLKNKIAFFQTYPSLNKQRVYCLKGVMLRRCGLCGLFLPHENAGVCSNIYIKEYSVNDNNNIKKPTQPEPTFEKPKITTLITQFKGKNQMIATETIEKAYGEGFEQALKVSKQKGEVYEPRPGFIAILQ